MDMGEKKVALPRYPRYDTRATMYLYTSHTYTRMLLGGEPRGTTLTDRAESVLNVLWHQGHFSFEQPHAAPRSTRYWAWTWAYPAGGGHGCYLPWSEPIVCAILNMSTGSLGSPSSRSARITLQSAFRMG